MKYCKAYYFILIIFCFSCGSLIKNTKNTSEREFRGVWIASVVNIDWPKNRSDAVKKQQEDFIEILEFYKKLHFNAVIVQIRTAGDALYPSKLAPWSRFLTGKEGAPPRPYYDPLAWMINESHQRGFEFHAWLNPYRATFDLDTSILDQKHDYHQHRDWMIKYGKKYYYNPGLPQVQQHLISVINEVVKNYDIDAIHFDDYFYPYKIKYEVFDDQLSYQQYAKSDQPIEDWRRENVNTLIRSIHTNIKARKPWVQFGISPFGVWRNKSLDPLGSDTEAGQTTYDDLYADPLTWMQNDWIDYLAPQLYWRLNHPKASYKKLVRWWNKNNNNTNIYIGNGAYKVRNNADRAWNKKKQLSKQIKLARKADNISGNIFFSAKSLLYQHNDITEQLSKSIYQQPSLPPSHVKEKRIDIIPKFSSRKVHKDSVTLFFKNDTTTTLRAVIVYHSKNNMSIFPPKIINEHIAITVPISMTKNKKPITITYLDIYKRESTPYQLNTMLIRNTEANE